MEDISNLKKCSKCRVVKPMEEFHNSSRARDGKQSKCKECFKKINKEFREKNPKYYWGSENSYFVERYEEIRLYSDAYNKANKNITIYTIDTPEGLYVGATKRLINLKIAFHRNNLLMAFENRRTNCDIKVLNDILIKYPIEEGYERINNAKIIFQGEGDREHMRMKSKQYIQYYNDKGLKVINILFNEKISRKKVIKKVWKYQRL
jgi:hypothetical protein